MRRRNLEASALGFNLSLESDDQPDLSLLERSQALRSISRAYRQRSEEYRRWAGSIVAGETVEAPVRSLFIDDDPAAYPDGCLR